LPFCIDSSTALNLNSALRFFGFLSLRSSYFYYRTSLYYRFTSWGSLPSIISGVEEELIKYKYYFQFNSVERENFEIDKINLNFSDLAGVILVGAYNEGFVLKLRELGLPMVLVDEYIPSEDIISVMIDNTDGILKACKYLHELKHERVAYISEEKNETTAYERYYGFKQAQEMFGFIKDDNLITECGGRISDGFKAMERILNRSRIRPTAVLAYNDIIAIGAMDAIKQHGLSIPKDISVIGFDDVRLAREVVPALTTVHVPKHLMGIISVQRLINVVQGKKDIIRKVLVPTKLKIRKSTAPLAG